jgi:hypothetical protein
MVIGRDKVVATCLRGGRSLVVEPGFWTDHLRPCWLFWRARGDRRAEGACAGCIPRGTDMAGC